MIILLKLRVCLFFIDIQSDIVKKFTILQMKRGRIVSRKFLIVWQYRSAWAVCKTGFSAELSDFLSKSAKSSFLALVVVFQRCFWSFLSVKCHRKPQKWTFHDAYLHLDTRFVSQLLVTKKLQLVKVAFQSVTYVTLGTQRVIGHVNKCIETK